MIPTWGIVLIAIAGAYLLLASVIAFLRYWLTPEQAARWGRWCICGQREWSLLIETRTFTLQEQQPYKPKDPESDEEDEDVVLDTRQCIVTADSTN